MENTSSNLLLIKTVPEAQTAPTTHPEATGDNPGTSEVTSPEKALLGNTLQKIDGLAAQEEGRKVTKEQLINRLNFINFQDDVIHIHFTHREYGRTLLVMAVPQPCLGDTLELRWLGTTIAALANSCSGVWG